MLSQLRYGTASRVSPSPVFSLVSIFLCVASKVKTCLFYDFKTGSLALFSHFSCFLSKRFFCYYVVSSRIPIFIQSSRDLFLYLHHTLGLLSIAPLRPVLFPSAQYVPKPPLLHCQSDISLYACTTYILQPSTPGSRIQYLYQRDIGLPASHSHPLHNLRTLQSHTHHAC